MTIRQDETSRLAVRLLGPLDVTVDGTRVTLGGRQLRSVFTLLAIPPLRPITTERLIAQLWDGAPPKGAVNTVQAYISRLRRLLHRSDSRGATPSGVLRSTPQGYLLDIPAEAIDLHRFEQAAAEGRTALAAGDPATAVRELQAALALWRGPALGDLTTSAGDLHRTRLEQLRLAAVADRIEAAAALGQATEIVPELQELVRRHPLDERFTGQLMTALYRSGRQAEALAAYARIRRRLGAELGVDPAPDLRTLNDEILRHATALRPARRSTRPAPTTGLIGRDHELRAARNLLAGPARVITLTGPHGVGRSRLADEIATRIAPRLDPPRTVLRQPPGSAGWLDADELLSRGLPPRDPGEPALLVVDQPLTAPAEELSALLNRNSRLSVLVVAAGPLGLDDEQVLAVNPLSRPAAVRLFGYRAAEHLPGFEVSSVNATEVGQICDLLGRLPLAIELAAARIRVLDLDRMLHRLRSIGHRRGIEALVHSGVLALPEASTRLLADLSVFTGSWTTAALAAISPTTSSTATSAAATSSTAIGAPTSSTTGDSHLSIRSATARASMPPEQALAVLTRTGLVVPAGPQRYALPSAVRQCASDLLRTRPPEQRRIVVERHAGFFATLVAPDGHPVLQRSCPARRPELEPEAVELEAALQHADLSQDGRLLGRLVHGLLGHWYATGQLRQADHWLDVARRNSPDPTRRAQLMLHAGRLTLMSADLERAVPALTAAEQAAEAAGEDDLHARCLALRSVAARYGGRPDQALELIEQALLAARAGGAWALVVRLGNEHGVLLDETGHPRAAESLFESFRAWSQVERSPGNQAVALVNLATVATRPERARELLAEAATAARSAPSATLRAGVLAGSGAVHLRLGQTEAAGTALRTAAALMRSTGQMLTLPDTISLLGAVAAAEGRQPAATRLSAVGRAWRQARGLAAVGRLTRELLATDAAVDRAVDAAVDAPARGAPDPGEAAAQAVPFADLGALDLPALCGHDWPTVGADLMTNPMPVAPFNPVDGRRRIVPVLDRRRSRPSYSGHSILIPDPDPVVTVRSSRSGGRVALPQGEGVAADSGP